MKTQTKSQILDLIEKNGQLAPKDLCDFLDISPQAVHRHLKSLLEENALEKVGEAPHVFYKLNSKPKTPYPAKALDAETSDFINTNFLYITPQGHIKKGVQGFFQWSTATNQSKNFENLTQEYIQTYKKWNRHKDTKTKVISAIDKFQETFNPSHLDQAYYLDFYSLPKFGKTSLGSMVLYAKQAQNKRMIKEIAELTKVPLKNLIKSHKIDAIVWAPHSLPRKIPFLKELRKQLKLNLNEVPFIKAYQGDLIIPQKSLSKLSERIENAQETIFPKNHELTAKRVLIIDDAVGSGATLEAIANKIKNINKKINVTGFALVGSIKGFEVIKEV